MTFALKDNQLVLSKALSNGAGSTVTDGVDLGHNAAALGRNLADFELLIESPALTTTELPDTETYSYSIETDDNAAFGSAKVLHANVMVQTGAGGAGAAAKSERVRLPSNVERHVRVRGTKTGTGDASAKTFSASFMF
jgi:hypothetical protein